jgi:hypothetical protein
MKIDELPINNMVNPIYPWNVIYPSILYSDVQVRKAPKLPEATAIPPSGTQDFLKLGAKRARTCKECDWPKKIIMTG